MLFVFLFELFLFHSITSSQNRFNTIFSFGDSDSDIGNVYNLTNSAWPIDPPYYEGRFSNGPMWIDRLNVSKMSNFAYGGATSDNNLVQGYTEFNIEVPGVRQQIALFRNQTNLGEIDFSRTAFFIWAGANDYLFNLTISPSSVVQSLMNSVGDLIQLGAKYIFIMNQPPVDKQPAVISFNAIDFFVNLVATHNSNLSNAIQTLQRNSSNVVLQLVDLNTLIGNLLSNMSIYGFNSTNQCWVFVNETLLSSCSSPETSIYIDQYHFSTGVHQLISDYVQTFFVSSDGLKSSISNIFLLSFLYLLNLTRRRNL